MNPPYPRNLFLIFWLTLQQFQSVNHDMRLKVYQLRVSQKFWYTTEFKIAWGLKTDIKII